ncbi:hypothetical protein COCC4DRAFT_155299 [Bipolaris maydis ATCC 48331]|uniref:Uncharacterized protein n=1 Tax=Cochliobolus heterostrophus (strain C4 / ATCC 48331 / race T) TaxID=665024 RepID=N4WED2_COCH4
MEDQESQRLVNTTYFVTPKDLQHPVRYVYPPSEASHLYFALAIEGYHYLGIQISVVPFSLNEFPGQIFHCAYGSFARCCLKIQYEPVHSSVYEVTETIYKTLIPWHNWDLRTPGIWYVKELPPMSCAESGLDSCEARTRVHLEHYMVLSPGSGSSTPSQMSDEISLSGISFGFDMTKQHKMPRRERRRRNSVDLTVNPMTGAVDAFLERINSGIISNTELLPNIASRCIETTSVSLSQENATRAWQMCISFSRQSNQKVKCGKFLRFLSLCFFLIWQRYWPKQGKSAAREINAKMREAGFSGSSRGLKTLRDETVLINSIIASIRLHCNFEQAQIMHHIIFDTSNYQFIRTINRLSKDRRESFVRYICENVDIPSLAAYPCRAISVQSIIKKYLPNIS